MTTQCRSNAVHNLRTGKHANLDRIDADVADYRIDLGFNDIQINPLNFAHAQGILRSDGSHYGHAIHTQGCHHLEVCL